MLTVSLLHWHHVGGGAALHDDIAHQVSELSHCPHQSRHIYHTHTGKSLRNCFNMIIWVPLISTKVMKLSLNAFMVNHFLQGILLVEFFFWACAFPVQNSDGVIQVFSKVAQLPLKLCWFFSTGMIFPTVSVVTWQITTPWMCQDLLY